MFSPLDHQKTQSSVQPGVAIRCRHTFACVSGTTALRCAAKGTIAGLICVLALFLNTPATALAQDAVNDRPRIGLALSGAVSFLVRIIGGQRHSITTEIVAERQSEHIDPRISIVQSRIGYVLVSKQEAGFPLPAKVGAESEVAGEKDFAPKILPFEA